MKLLVTATALVGTLVAGTLGNPATEQIVWNIIWIFYILAFIIVDIKQNKEREQEKIPWTKVMEKYLNDNKEDK